MQRLAVINLFKAPSSRMIEVQPSDGELPLLFLVNADVCWLVSDRMKLNQF
jgi:hypothetical protein